MPIFMLYIIIFIFSSMASFSSLSKGSWFTERVKFVILIISLTSLALLCLFTSIFYSWVHIFGLIYTYLFAAWISSYIIKKI